MSFSSGTGLASDEEMVSAGSMLQAVQGAVDTPKPSPASPVQQAKARLTPTQEAIRAILHVDLEKGVGAAVETLMKLEARPLSASMTAAELDPSANPRAACYDWAGVPSSWASLDVCTRCRALNQVLQVSAKQGSGAMSSGIIGLALLTTFCSSEKHRSGKTPKLPLELVCFVIQCCIDDMRSSSDGSALCALMHVSSWVRLKVIEAFEPVTLYECDSPSHTQRRDYRLPRELVTYVWDSVSYWLLDPTIQRHKVRSPSREACHGIITTTSGLKCKLLKCKLEVESDSIVLSNGRSVAQASRLERSSNGYSADDHSVRSVRGICAAIHLAIATLGPVPRFASPYANISSGALKASCGAIIKVSLQLQEPTDRSVTMYTKTWQFDTLCVRPVAFRLSQSPT